MKIGTITLHCTDNSGSTLQAYALQTFLIRNGFESEIIDYRPRYLIKYGNPLKRLIKNIVFFKEVKSQKRKNKAFEKKYLIETKNTYKKYSDLKKNPPVFDAYITGSDQIWNLSYRCGSDLAFYLDFVSKEKKTIAYAASVGKTNVPQTEKDFICRHIKNINHISVREKSTKVFLENERFEGIEYVCDPTLLLSKEDYSSIEKRKIKEKYIVIYLVQPSKLLDKLIERIRNAYHCKVVLIYGVADNCYCDLHIRDTSPDEFLGYIDGAEFVIASSFHAVMFSHIFEKNFAIVLPNSNQARIEQFLEITNLSNRIVRTEKDVDALELPIDYSAVRPLLQGFREHSEQFLLNSIKGVSKNSL